MESTSYAWDLSEPHYLRSFSWGDLRAERAKRRAGDGRVILPQHITCLTLGKEKRMDVAVGEGPVKNVAAPRNTFTFIPAETEVTATRDEDHEYLCVFQEQALFDEVADSMRSDDAPSLRYLTSVADPLVTQVMLAISQEAQSGGANGKLYVDALSQTLASRIIQLQSELTPSEDLYEATGSARFDLKKVTEYIEAYLIEDLSVSELAKLVDMSPYSFSRAFKDATGISPYQYVLNQRIERAKSLLGDPTVSIADVAYHVGFSSQSHMTTVFSKNVGMTPKVLRESSF